MQDPVFALALTSLILSSYATHHIYRLPLLNNDHCSQCSSGVTNKIFAHLLRPHLIITMQSSSLKLHRIYSGKQAEQAHDQRTILRSNRLPRREPCQAADHSARRLGDSCNCRSSGGGRTFFSNRHCFSAGCMNSRTFSESRQAGTTAMTYYLC